MTSQNPDRQNKDRQNQDGANKEPGNDNFWAQFAKYSEIAFIFPAATVGGLLIGIALDHWLHTTWLYIVGLFLGIIAGFIQLVRTGLSSENNQ